MASYNPNDYLQSQFFEQLEYKELVKNDPLDIDLYSTLNPPLQPLSFNQTFEIPQDIPDFYFLTPSSGENTSTTSSSNGPECDVTPSSSTNQQSSHLHRSPSTKIIEKTNSYLCDWPNCKRRQPFSNKGSLTRHQKTQHLAPRSLRCPKGCDKFFSRKDNLNQHLRSAVHWKN